MVYKYHNENKLKLVKLPHKMTVYNYEDEDKITS